MIEGIKYEKIVGEYWEMRRFEEPESKELLRYFDNLIAVQKSIYDYIEYDSEVERQFAKDLDNMEEVKLFVKLPPWFKVETPIGTYNPDWAIVKHGDDTLYLVRETKSTVNKDKLRKSELDKITCGKKHFDKLAVDFKVVAKAQDI
jgi:type III restriction enzyme